MHVDGPRDASVCQFTGQPDDRGLGQHATEATDVLGHILGVFITRDVSSIIQGSPVIANPCLYDAKHIQYDDYCGIEVTLDCSKPQNQREENIFHRVHSVMLSSTDGPTHDMVEAYNSDCQASMEKHTLL